MSKAKAQSRPKAGGGPLADNFPPLPEDLDRLRGQLVPFESCFFEETASTNTAAVGLLAEGRIKPLALVVAGRQTAGRGQRGRIWFSGRQDLAATFVLPINEQRPIGHLPILVGLAAREALAGLVGEIGLKIKWPNDILVSGRKLAGILCERKHGADIVGVGVNIRHEPGEVPEELGDVIIALADVIAPPVRWDVLLRVTRSLRETLLETPAADAWNRALEHWPAHDALLGCELQVDTPQGILAGTAAGIDADGRLRLLSADGREHAVVSGTVRSIL